MSPKLPRITAADLIRALRQAGWFPDYQTGSHLYMRHARKAGKVTVPIHARREIKPKTLQSILDQAGMSVDELIELL